MTPYLVSLVVLILVVFVVVQSRGSSKGESVKESTEEVNKEWSGRWFERKPGESYSQFKKRVAAKRKRIEEAGLYQGKPISEYVETVKELKRKNRTDEAIALLLNLVKTTEAQSKEEEGGVAPGYYEQLAILYRKSGRIAEEVEILERFASQRHSPGSSPPKLLKRLEKARELSEKA